MVYLFLMHALAYVYLRKPADLNVKKYVPAGASQEGDAGGCCTPSKQSRRQNPNIHRQISANSGESVAAPAERYCVSS